QVKDAGYPTTFNSFNATGAMLDTMSTFDWIEAFVPGGHDSPMGQLLDVAYNIEYGAETTDQSSLNLVYLLGFQPNANGKAIEIFGQSDERYHVRGGNQQIPNAIAASLGASVRYGYSLLSIARTPAGRYALAFNHGKSTVNVTADYVVLAIPFAVLRNLDYSAAGFDALKNTAIQELG